MSSSPGQERGPHPLRGVLGERDLHLGVGVVEVSQERGHIEGVAGGAGDKPDRDPASQQSGELVHRLPHPLYGGQRGPRIRQHGPASL